MNSNRLSGSTSPYLQAHADNPVHWHPWGPEPFAEARERGVPVLVSVGYATCHWCHVMAAESFMDPETAALINDNMVAVKVDREQHPDVDAYYLQAAVALSGQGGWPMTVFTDAEGRPFFADTYFPPVPKQGRPSFRQVLEAVSRTWSDERARVDELTVRLNEAIEASGEEDGAEASWAAQDVTAELPTRIVQKMRASEHPTGGFGGAPKFPPSAAVLGLVRWAERTNSDAARTEVLDIVGRTMAALLQGGLVDPVDGGFHRYCVDENWTVPHFEKTLYDNALLLRALAAYSARRPDDALVAEALELTRSFLTRGLGTGVPGLLASGLDADTVVDGTRVEGYTYTWAPGELESLGLSGEGDVDGRVVLTRREGLPLSPELREALRQARSSRPRPAVDGKVVTAWNAMAAVALTEAGDPESGAAVTTALWNHAVTTDAGGSIVDVVRCTGSPQAPGTLEDCAWLLLALVRLWEHQGSCSDTLEIPAAVSELVRHIQVTFHRGPGTWYDAAAPVAGTGVRPRDPYDGATPTAVAVLSEALSMAGTVATSLDDADVRAVGARWSAEARRILDAHVDVVDRHLAQAGGWLCALECHLAGPVQATVAGATPSQVSALRTRLGTSCLVLSVEQGARLLGTSDSAGAAVVQMCRAGVCGVPTALGDDGPLH
ncbi:thioredoxin domain-containing protein [Corynebacterium glyciniphilum]|uniref:thioredoxin domain-containing protein n=1 Tax=Corynebacterium glyciniphilum TaxID=1404244 RepID=UPI003DA1854F